jgi:hypothetical protein
MKIIILPCRIQWGNWRDDFVNVPSMVWLNKFSIFCPSSMFCKKAWPPKRDSWNQHSGKLGFQIFCFFVGLCSWLLVQKLKSPIIQRCVFLRGSASCGMCLSLVFHYAGDFHKGPFLLPFPSGTHKDSLLIWVSFPKDETGPCSFDTLFEMLRVHTCVPVSGVQMHSFSRLSANHRDMSTPGGNQNGTLLQQLVNFRPHAQAMRWLSLCCCISCLTFSTPWPVLHSSGLLFTYYLYLVTV